MRVNVVGRGNRRVGEEELTMVEWDGTTLLALQRLAWGRRSEQLRKLVAEHMRYADIPR